MVDDAKETSNSQQIDIDKLQSASFETGHCVTEMELDQSIISLEGDLLPQEGSKFESNSSLKVFFLSRKLFLRFLKFCHFFRKLKLPMLSLNLNNANLTMPTFKTNLRMR